MTVTHGTGTEPASVRSTMAMNGGSAEAAKGEFRSTASGATVARVHGISRTPPAATAPPPMVMPFPPVERRFGHAFSSAVSRGASRR